LVLLDPAFNFLWVNEAYAKACQRTVAEFPGHNHFDFYPSEAKAIFEEVVLSKKAHQATARPFIFPDHPERGVTYWDWALVPILDPVGEVRLLVFSLEDVTQRRIAEQHTKATNQLLRLFVKKSTRKTYLDAVAELLREASGCCHVGIRMRMPDDSIPHEAAVGFDSEFLQSEHWLQLGRDECICTRVIDGRPGPEHELLTPAGSFCSNNASQFLSELNKNARAAFRGVCARRGYATLAVIPIRHQETILGAIHLADERPGRLSAPVVEFLESLAPLIGDAVHRFDIEDALRTSGDQLRTLNLTLERRADQLRAMASELTLVEQRERRRLAQILHDHLQQLLVAAKIKIGMLRRRELATESGQSLGQIDELLSESIRTSRSLTVDLSPPILFDAGLRPALEWLARQMREKHGLVVDVESEAPQTPLSEDAQILAFQAVRELLFNVVKHAGVAHARLQLAVDAKQVQVVVEDDGVGFDATQLEHHEVLDGGLGLFSIKERLEVLGGQVLIDSSPGQGTRAVILVPCQEEEVSELTDDASHPAVNALDGSSEAPAKKPSPEPHRRIRVLLADDHKILRQGLAGLLLEEPDMEVVGEAGDGLEAVEMAQRLCPDVVLMDVTMPHLDGIEATQRITESLPQVRVIGLSMHEEKDLAAAMQAAGAVAYLSKGGSSDLLIATIRGIVAAERSIARK
jgi:signal transduction histidine kinase/ActR/RegA family two-component response regulator